MNHCISASCPARSSVDRSPISASRKALASSMSGIGLAGAQQQGKRSCVEVSNCRRMSFLPVRLSSAIWSGRRHAAAPTVSPSRQTGRRRPRRPPREREPTTGWVRQTQPGEMDEGAAEQRDEQPVAARRLEAQDADARIAAGRGVFPDRHPASSSAMTQKNSAVGSVQAIHEKLIGSLLTPSPGRSPWRCSCGRTRSRARPE